MPIAKIQLPDGRIAKFEVPEGTTQEQVLAFAEQNMPQAAGPLSTDFPEQRGETRAARELPELGAGGLLSGENQAKVAAIAPVLLTTTDPQEMAGIISSNFPNIGISQSPAGELLATNNRTGRQVILNKPGVSQLDVLQFLGIGSAFFPTGAGIRGIGVPALAKLAGRSAAVQAGLESAQALAGGEFDPGTIAAAGIAAPVGQVAGEKVLSPVARIVGGKISDAAKSIIEEGKKRGVRILTTDLAPPETFLGKALQQVGEKLGPLGTGSARANQQRARVEIIEELANKLDVSLDNTSKTSEIVKSLEKGVLKRLQNASLIRRQAVDELDPLGDVPVDKAIAAIDEQIARQQSLRGQADASVIEKLQALRSDLQNANFGLLASLRSNLADDIRLARRGEALSTKADAPLQAVKSSLDDDMMNFAKENSRTAASKWLKSNRLFADSFKKAKETELKRILTKGTETPENIGSQLRGGKLSELRRLNQFLDDKGKAAARVSIIRDALEESGFFAGNVNPDRFATAMSKPSRQRAISVFFKGKDKDQVDGMVRLLDATRRAQQQKAGTTTGLGEAGIAAAPIAITQVAASNPALGAFFSSGLIGSAKAYESKFMRDLLLTLKNTPRGSAAEQEVLSKIMPSLLGGIQSLRAQVQDNAPAN